MSQQAISELLDSLTCETVGICLDTLAEGLELMPTLAYCNAAGDMECLTFDDDTLENCLFGAAEYLKSLGKNVQCYALAYSGFVVLDEDEGTTDALIVEFGERGASTAYSLYVPYSQGIGPDDFENGEPQAAGEEPLLFDE